MSHPTRKCNNYLHHSPPTPPFTVPLHSTHIHARTLPLGKQCTKLAFTTTTGTVKSICMYCSVVCKLSGVRKWPRLKIRPIFLQTYRKFVDTHRGSSENSSLRLNSLQWGWVVLNCVCMSVCVCAGALSVVTDTTMPSKGFCVCFWTGSI